MDYEGGRDKINDKNNNKFQKEGYAEDKILKSPVSGGDKYKASKEAIPFTPPEDVKLYHYNIKKPFKSFRKIYARSYNSWESDAAINDINEKLKEKASNLGANAIINVSYEKGILTLFRGIRGIGQAVYIKDLENIEKTYPAGNTFLLIYGFFWLIWGLLDFYNYYKLFLVLIGLSMIIYCVFARHDYITKTFLLAFLSIIVIGGLMWGNYILKNGIQLSSFGFYLGTGVFTALLISFVYSYLKKRS